MEPEEFREQCAAKLLKLVEPTSRLHAFVGLAAPRGTPKEIVLKLNEAMRSAMADPAFKDHLVTMGMRPKPLTPEDYRAFLTREAARWKEYVKTAKIEPQ